MKKIFLFICFCSVLSCFAQDKTEKYIAKYKDIAIIEMNRYGIPASITLAQGILGVLGTQNAKIEKITKFSGI